MMKIAKFQFNMFGVNGYAVWSQTTKECMIVDPGMIQPEECKLLDEFISKEELRIKYLVNTHLHLDHCFGNNYISKKYDIITLAHPDDHFLGNTLQQQSAMFGIYNTEIKDITTIEPLSDGTELTLGDEIIRVIHVPGHSPGGIALYAPDDNWVIVGDSIFANGGIGRTDLPGGDYKTLIYSITDKLFTLPASTVILPGHGPKSTIEEERLVNPYI